jgi:hypothetical protein
MNVFKLHDFCTSKNLVFPEFKKDSGNVLFIEWYGERIVSTVADTDTDIALSILLTKLEAWLNSEYNALLLLHLSKNFMS